MISLKFCDVNKIEKKHSVELYIKQQNIKNGKTIGVVTEQHLQFFETLKGQV